MYQFKSFKSFKSFKFKLLLLIFIIDFTLPVLAEQKESPRCENILAESKSAESTPIDLPITIDLKGGNSVELEMSFSSQILDLLTTKDGTVGSLFDNKKLPLFFILWVKQFKFITSPKLILWDSLNHRIKYKLLQEVTKQKKSDFFSDRRIPNVKIKPFITLKFKKSTQFLGKNYPPGEYLIETKGFGAVEYKSPKAAKDMSGVELHLRSDSETAGSVFRNAWDFQEAIQVPRTHLHEHIVVPIPIEQLKQDSIRTSLALTELYRRANLFGEFIRVLKLQNVEHVVNKKGNIQFSSLTGFNLYGIYTYLTNFLNAPYNIKNNFKMAYVGFRGHIFYDQDHMMGFEVRFIREDDDPELIEKFLNALEIKMRTGNYELNPNLIDKQFTEISTNSTWELTKNFFISRWYRQQGDLMLFSSLPTYLKDYYSNNYEKVSYKIYQLSKVAKKNFAAEMLIYDWKSDPLLFDRPELQQRVAEAQIKALGSYFKKPSSIKNILKQFIIDSGLLEVLGEYFELTKEDFSHFRNYFSS